MTDRVRLLVDDGLESYRESLFTLLEQPSISTEGVGMDACAETLLHLLERYGLDATRRIETETHDLLYGEYLVGDGRPTVLFYGHYDVQPADNDAEWRSDPFEPTLRDDSIFARGVGDNKGQLLAHVFALDVATTIDPGLAFNVKVLFEGGEESGSVGLQSYLDGEPPELEDVDFVFVSDGPMHSSGDPTIIYGNRGLLAMELVCETARTDLHSGNYGGPMPNAAEDLARVVASLYEGDRSTEVAVEGFYDDIAVKDWAVDLIARVPYDPSAIEAETGVTPSDAAEYYTELLLTPTLSVNGLMSGHAGDGIKTVIPATARATLDARLVPDQVPSRIYERIERHVENHPVPATLTKLGELPPMQSSPDGPYANAIRRALIESWEVRPVEMPLMGGSLPSAYIQDALSVPVFIVPYANPDQGNHSPNEHLTMECFRSGILTSANFLLDAGT